MTAALDRYIPSPDARERVGTTVGAPASIVLETAAGFDMQSVPAVRAILRLRERLLGAAPPAPRQPQGLLEETRSLGWGLLEEQPGRLIACGATCQPWLADVRFVAVAPDAFAGYAQPDQVKIAWTLEAEPLGPALTRLSQETRALATDASAKFKFRRYWRWARFGIVAIRLLLLPAIRREAERRWVASQDGR